jgi:hypothetical protein
MGDLKWIFLNTAEMMLMWPVDSANRDCTVHFKIANRRPEPFTQANRRPETLTPANRRSEHFTPANIGCQLMVYGGSEGDLSQYC